MYKLAVSILMLGFSFKALATIIIHELSGTDSAQLGSNKTTLKCDYDIENEEGVVIKWFYNDILIFMWIPGYSPPQATGPFKNLLEVTNSTIHFKKVTENLTGNYTCHISSFYNEVSETQPMVVYKPAQSIEFFMEEPSDALICSAYQVYPLPLVNVYGSVSLSGSNESVPVEFVDEYAAIDYETEFLNVTKIFKFDKDALQSTVEFVCDVHVPHTNYKEKRIVVFDKYGNGSTIEYHDYPEFTTETLINSTPFSAN